MAKKTIEMDLKVTFTQSVEVEVDEEMLPLIEDYWCQEINILECHKDPKEKKITDKILQCKALRNYLSKDGTWILSLEAFASSMPQDFWEVTNGHVILSALKLI